MIVLILLLCASVLGQVLTDDKSRGRGSDRGRYTIILTDDAPPPPPPPSISRLFITTNVPLAEVIVNNRLRYKTDETGKVRQAIDLKQATKAVVTVRHPDYNEVSQTFSLTPGKYVLESITLVSKYGDLLLGGVPEESVIYVDDKEIKNYVRDNDQQVSLKKLPVGMRKLRITHPDYIEWNGELEVKPGVPTPFNVPMERALAQLLVETLPGAKVYLNGEEKGEVPAERKLLVADIVPGSYEVLVSKKGYVDQKVTEQLKVGENTLSVKLLPIPNSADFDEYFKSGLSKWVAPAEWKVQKDGLIVTGQNTFGFPKGYNYRDFDALFSFRMNNAKGIAWALRIQDEGKNYYLFYLTGPNHPKFPNQLRTYVVKDGHLDLDSPVLADPATIIKFTNTDIYTIRIAARGNKIETFITPETGKLVGREFPIGAFIDEASNFTFGNLGFRTLDGEEFYVKDLHARPVE
ncbi:MAG: PEGA domain-containing protein [Acidobacteriota bacterium]|nr:PEGA domain-containing protein [Blastocatellia bacterium]MDW8413791.1 PEGA domain-containing protein [Acidobacteriota bacterium]